MMKVREDGAKPSELNHERQSLQNSEWFVRTDLRSLSHSRTDLRALSHSPSGPYQGSPYGMFLRSGRAMSSANGEKIQQAHPVLPMKPKLISVRDRSRKSRLHDLKEGDTACDEDDDDDEGLQKSRSEPSLKRWKSTSFELGDVLGLYRGNKPESNSLDNSKANATAAKRMMNTTAPPSLFGSKEKGLCRTVSMSDLGTPQPGALMANTSISFASSATITLLDRPITRGTESRPTSKGGPNLTGGIGSLCNGLDDESAAENMSAMKRTMLHAKSGLVRRISLDPQTIC